MSIDSSKFQNLKLSDEPVHFNRRDLLLYALGINATDLKFTYELDPDFQAFPTYALVLGGNYQDVNSYAERTAKGFLSALVKGGLKVNLNRLVHGEQYYELMNGPLPSTGGNFTLSTKLNGVYDIGKSMVIETESLLLQDGKPIVKQISTAFVIGGGGFDPNGPKPAKKQSYAVPKDKQPDWKYTVLTSSSQALLYRLSGDYNPLHADPSIGTKIGMNGAILHGLCSLGIAANSIIKTVLGNDAKRFKSINARFASPVYPGDSIETLIWKVEGKDNVVVFMSFANGKAIITGGVCEFYPLAKI